jgi:hypothetical protein
MYKLFDLHALLLLLKDGVDLRVAVVHLREVWLWLWWMKTSRRQVMRLILKQIPGNAHRNATNAIQQQLVGW